MLNSAKIILAVHRKCAISEKIWGKEGSPGPSPGSTTAGVFLHEMCVDGRCVLVEVHLWELLQFQSHFNL